MTAALTPDAALAWLATLTPGLRAAVVLDGSRSVVAGDAGLAGPARDALAADAAAAEIRGPDGLYVARGPAHAIAAKVDPAVLGGLLLTDLRATLAALAGPGGTPPRRA